MLSSSSPSPRLQDRSYHQIESPSPSPYQMTTVTYQHASAAQKSRNDFYAKTELTIVGIFMRNLKFPCRSYVRTVNVHWNRKHYSMKVWKGFLSIYTLVEPLRPIVLNLKIFSKNSNIPYAIFKSSPVTIISKPSKKTTKARNVSSCILSGTFNRINSQTVRTKYMDIEGGQLCAKNSSWSSFVITIVENNDINNNGNNVHGLSSFSFTSVPPKGSMSSSSPSSNSTPITYGSEVILSDPTTGFTSDRLIIRKVERGRVVQGACGPVSQM